MFPDSLKSMQLYAVSMSTTTEQLLPLQHSSKRCADLHRKHIEGQLSASNHDKQLAATHKSVKPKLTMWRVQITQLLAMQRSC